MKVRQSQISAYYQNDSNVSLYQTQRVPKHSITQFYLLNYISCLLNNDILSIRFGKNIHIRDTISQTNICFKKYQSNSFYSRPFQFISMVIRCGTKRFKAVTLFRNYLKQTLSIKCIYVSYTFEHYCCFIFISSKLGNFL